MRHDIEQRTDARRAGPPDARPGRRGVDRNHVVQVAAGVFALLVLSHVPFSRLLRPLPVGARAEPFHSVSERMVRPAYAVCEDRERRDCVVDGATFWKDGVKYRVAGIETPEPYPGGCAHERDMVGIARSALLDRLNAGPVRIAALGPTPPGNAGRPVRVALGDGRGLAQALVAGRTARRSGAANPWCDVIDDRFGTDAATARGDRPPAATRGAGDAHVGPPHLSDRPAFTLR